MIKGRIYDIQGFSVQDGPGIRTTVFLKGCPLHCPWCHSPESQSFEKELSYTDLKCIGHEYGDRCMERCSQGAISLVAVMDALGQTHQKISIDRKKCNGCMRCVKECAAKALVVCGTDYTVEEVLDRLKRDISYYEHSRGGVTISGGECFSQPDFTLELLRGCKGLGIHTAVDTTGFAQWEIIEKVLPYTNLFLYDLKHMNSKIHETVVGVPNEKILENVQLIAKKGNKIQIRIPLIPQFNDSEENLRATAEFCKSLGAAVTEIQVLPYHRLGTAKLKKIKGNDYPVFEAAIPTQEHVNACVCILAESGIKIVVH